MKRDIRQGNWKYLAHQGSGGNRYPNHRLLKEYYRPDTAPDAPAQLYYLEQDPGETTNRYFQHEAVVERMKSQLAESIEAGRSAPRR